MKPVINHSIVYDEDCVSCSHSMAWIARHNDMRLIRFGSCPAPAEKLRKRLVA